MEEQQRKEAERVVEFVNNVFVELSDDYKQMFRERLYELQDQAEERGRQDFERYFELRELMKEVYQTPHDERSKETWEELAAEANAIANKYKPNQ